MDKKRFQMGRRIDVVSDIYDSQYDKLLILSDVVDLLNTQQAKIHRDEMSIKTMISNMEKLEKEIVEQQATNDYLEEANSRLQIQLGETLRLVDEQQATINKLQGDINRLQYIIEELRKDNYKRFEKINELKAQLREKEEDERLYANEIVKLNKEAKEVLDFKSLGGDY